MDEFVTGLLLGTVLGLVLDRALRWWVALHEWRRASAEARLTDEVLRRMLQESRPSEPAER